MLHVQALQYYQNRSYETALHCFIQAAPLHLESESEENLQNCNEFIKKCFDHTTKDTYKDIRDLENLIKNYIENLNSQNTNNRYSIIIRDISDKFTKSKNRKP